MSMSLHLSGMPSLSTTGNGSVRCSSRFLPVATIYSSLRCLAWVAAILPLFNRLPENSDLNNHPVTVSHHCVHCEGRETVLQFYVQSMKATGIWLGGWASLKGGVKTASLSRLASWQGWLKSWA